MSLLLISILVSALLYIFFVYIGKPVPGYILKPLTTILIIMLAMIQVPGVSVTYKYLIIAGLFMSLAGDVFLMFPSEKFVHGLTSFLAAHVCYILAFASDFGPFTGWWYLIPVIAYAFLFLRIILPYTCTLRIPVIIYAIVMGVFLWQAAGRAWYLGDVSAQRAFFGALLFVASDSFLAYDHFVKRFRWAPLLIMISYWGAQLLIALSV